MLTIKQPLIVGDKVIIDEVHFTIDNGEHIAIIGDNGVGKSVLMRTLADQLNIDILEQSIHSELTVMDYIYSANKQLYALKLKKDKEMDYIGAYIEQGGYDIENEIIMMLKRFQLNEDAADQKVKVLSGGEQTKVGLIKLLIARLDVLLFDEPTNHIDIETRDWLIQWSKQSKQTIVYVSHDRNFINETASKIIELTTDGARTYHLNYDDYIAEKKREKKENAALVDKERKEKQKMKQMIQKMKEWHHEAASKASVRSPGEQKKVAKIAKRYKTKEHQLNQKKEKFKGVTKKEFRTDLSLHHSKFEAKQLARFENVSFSFDHQSILSNINFSIEKGDKIAIEGRNGSGKSTLLKLLINDLVPEAGKVTVNPSTQMGYFSQQLEYLNMDTTILDEVLSVEDIEVSEARTTLALFRFKADRMDNLVKHLSMGEKCRLTFIKLYFSKANLLVLDEPTNYFDITMQEIIENMLINYQGAIVFVSHDRYFNDAVANRRLKLENGQLIDQDKILNHEIDTHQLIDVLHELED